MNRLDEISTFASKYLGLYESESTSIPDVEEGFADACFAFGFEMDCGQRFIGRYSERAFYDAEELRRVIGDVDDVDPLGSAIFSRWRYVTHWAESSLLAEEHCRWFIIAFARLIEITSEDHAAPEAPHAEHRDDDGLLRAADERPYVRNRASSYRRTSRPARETSRRTPRPRRPPPGGRRVSRERRPRCRGS